LRCILTRMARWTLILFAVMIVAAIVGFLIDAVRILAGLAFVVCLVVLIAKGGLSWIGRRGS